MRTFLVVVSHPLIDILLQLFDRFVELRTESDLIKLLQHGLMEALTDTIGLWASGFGPGVIDSFKSQVQFIFVMLWRSAVLGTAIGEHTQHGHALLFEEWQDLVIECIGSHERILAVVKLGESNS